MPLVLQHHSHTPQKKDGAASDGSYSYYYSDDDFLFAGDEELRLRSQSFGRVGMEDDIFASSNATGNVPPSPRKFTFEVGLLVRVLLVRAIT